MLAVKVPLKVKDRDENTKLGRTNCVEAFGADHETALNEEDEHGQRVERNTDRGESRRSDSIRCFPH